MKIKLQSNKIRYTQHEEQLRHVCYVNVPVFVIIIMNKPGGHFASCRPTAQG